MNQAYKAIIWCAVIYSLGVILISIYLVMSVNHPVSFDEGQQIGSAFKEKYGTVWFLLSLVIAVVGTATNKLPFTKRKRNITSK